MLESNTISTTKIKDDIKSDVKSDVKTDIKFKFKDKDKDEVKKISFIRYEEPMIYHYSTHKKFDELLSFVVNKGCSFLYKT